MGWDGLTVCALGLVDDEGMCGPEGNGGRTSSIPSSIHRTRHAIPPNKGSSETTQETLASLTRVDVRDGGEDALVGVVPHRLDDARAHQHLGAHELFVVWCGLFGWLGV